MISLFNTSFAVRPVFDRSIMQYDVMYMYLIITQLFFLLSLLFSVQTCSMTFLFLSFSLLCICLPVRCVIRCAGHFHPFIQLYYLCFYMFILLKYFCTYISTSILSPQTGFACCQIPFTQNFVNMILFEFILYRHNYALSIIYVCMIFLTLI